MTAGALLLCSGTPSQARAFDPSVPPAVLHRALKTAGIDAEIIDTGSVDGSPCSLYIPDLKGAAVTVFFPGAGLRRGVPFSLEIDGMMAAVRCSDNGEFEFLDGDRRLAASGVFDIIGCILNTTLDSIFDLIKAIASFNIAGILEAVFQLVFGIIPCL